MSSVADPKKLFQQMFRGQITVPRPSCHDLQSATGGVYVATAASSPNSFLVKAGSSSAAVSVQGGPYSSMWVRIHTTANTTSTTSGGNSNSSSSTAVGSRNTQLWDWLRSVIAQTVEGGGASGLVSNVKDQDVQKGVKFVGVDDTFLENFRKNGSENTCTDDIIDGVKTLYEKPINYLFAPKKKMSSYAIYIGLVECDTSQTELIPRLLEEGFVFLQWCQPQWGVGGVSSLFRVPSHPSAGEMVYYKWIGVEKDRVPSPSTTQGGIGGLILDKKQENLLLIHEYGWWKPVTGMVNLNENKIDALARECMEEVGVKIRTDEVYLVGGWQKGGNWDQLVNDEFSMFLVIAETDELKPDGEEITEAKWVPLSKIPLAPDKFDGETRGSGMEEIHIDGVGRLNPKVCRWLGNYFEKNSFRCIPSEGRWYWN